MGLETVVGIATGYWLDGLWIESRLGGEIFCTSPDRPWGPPSFVLGTPGGKDVGAWRRTLTI